MADKPPTWPRWWEWDVALTHHVRKRMIDRGFTELDLLGMLDRASGLHPGLTPGRWVIVTRFGGVLWHVVVEPDLETLGGCHCIREEVAAVDEPRLEITYRRGRPLAAYYYLPGPPDRKCCRSTEYEPGIVVDFARGGRPLGVEIIDPTTTTVRAMNRVLRKIGAEPLRREDLGPLLAA